MPTPEPSTTVSDERINKNGRYWALHPEEYEFWGSVNGGKVIKRKNRESNHWLIIKNFVKDTTTKRSKILFVFTEQPDIMCRTITSTSYPIDNNQQYYIISDWQNERDWMDWNETWKSRSNILFPVRMDSENAIEVLRQKRIVPDKVWARGSRELEERLTRTLQKVAHYFPQCRIFK